MKNKFSRILFLIILVLTFGISGLFNNKAQALCNPIPPDPGSPPSISSFTVSPDPILSSNTLTTAGVFLRGGQCVGSGEGNVIYTGTPSIDIINSAGTSLITKLPPTGLTCPPSGPGPCTFNPNINISSLPGGTYTALFQVDNDAPNGHVQTTQTFTVISPLTGSCSASPNPATINSTTGVANVTWTATASGGTGPYTYNWVNNGRQDDFSASGNNIVKSYSVTGAKYGEVVIGSGSGATEQSFVPSDCYVLVRPIAPQNYNLTVVKNGNGSGTVTSSPVGITCGGDCETYTEGTPVTLLAFPVSGSSFTGWSVSVYGVNSGACPGIGSCSVTINGDTVITATFTPTPISYTVTATKGTNIATISPTSQSVNAGSPAYITFTTIGGTGTFSFLGSSCPVETSPTNPWYDPMAGYWNYYTGAIQSNCNVIVNKQISSTAPVVDTTAPTSITATSAVGGGNVISEGGDPVTARGVVWSTSTNPTISLSTKTNNGTGLGSFTSVLAPLSPGTTYYVRAYAKNSVGTSYGSENIFTTLQAPPDNPMSGTLTGPASCIISSGANNCVVDLSWSITNPVGTPTAITSNVGSYTVSNSLTSPQSGTQFVPVPYNNKTFYLYNNGVQLAWTAVTSSCESGTDWNTTSQTCAPTTAPINGGWSAWSAQTLSCGGQTGTQTRTCTNPSPANGGLLCTDPANPNYDGGGSSRNYTTAACSGTDLVAFDPTFIPPTYIGVAQTFYSTIKNVGNASTVSPGNDGSFANKFQTSPMSDGSSGVVNYSSTPSPMAPLNAGVSATATSVPIIFPTGTPSTMYVRACADLPPDPNGVIIEGNEGNNCSNWVAVPVTSGIVNDASCTSITAPSSVVAGQPFSASVKMKNTGSKIWYNENNNNPYPHRLGTQSPQDTTRWAPLPGGHVNRVVLPSTTVAPGSSATFNFTATAPSFVGAYNFNWEMVQEGQEWFGATCTTIINVTAAPSLPDLIVVDGSVAPTSATVNVPTGFTAQVKNIGNASTGGSFPVFLQRATAADGGGTRTSLLAQMKGPLEAGGSLIYTSQAYNFPSTGIYSVMVCADKSSPSDAGVINEGTSGGENNNCSPWINVNVTNAPVIPTVTTKNSCTSITQNSAINGGTTVSNGGSPVTVAGLVWNTAPIPLTTTPPVSPYTTDGWAINGPWTSSMSGLTANTLYHIRAYATNNVGTAYGSDVTCTTLGMSGTMSANSNPCSIPLNGNSCTTTLTWNVNNPENVGGSQVTSSYPSAGTVVAPLVSTGTADSGTKTNVTIPYNSRTFFLYNNAKKLAQVDVAANCVAGTDWNGTICAKTYIVTGTAGAKGTISPPTQSAFSGETKTLIVTPNPGYTASASGCFGGSLSGTTFTTGPITANCTVTATFTIGGGGPNLTASAISPATATGGVVQTYTATITNIGDVATGSASGLGAKPFPYFFQTATLFNGGGAVQDLTPAGSINRLIAGQGINVDTSIVSPQVSFATGATPSIRVCADKSSSRGGGVITETAEGDNCGDWTNVTVCASGDPCKSSYPILSVGMIDISNYTIALLQKDSKISRVKRMQDNAISVLDKFIPTAYASGAVFSGLPTRLSTPVTNSGALTNLTFTNKYFIDIGNDNNLLQPGVGTGWDEVVTGDGGGAGYPITVNGIGENPTTINSIQLIPGGFPVGPVGIVFCADVNNNISEKPFKDDIANRCTNKLIGDILPPASGPDLTAGTPTPTSAEAGTIVFSSVITNSGTVATGAGFNNLFQTSASSDGSSPTNYVINVAGSLSSTSGSNTVTITKSLPLSAGTYYMRVCADNNASFVGTIVESNENNNCSNDVSWTTVTILPICSPNQGNACGNSCGDIGTIGCDGVTCSAQESSCPVGICGNGTVETPEQCDYGNDPVFGNGAPNSGCSDTCAFTTAGGICKLKHWECSSPATSGNNKSGTSKWTWTCGTAQCLEFKKAPKFIEN